MSEINAKSLFSRLFKSRFSHRNACETANVTKIICFAQHRNNIKDYK